MPFTAATSTDLIRRATVQVVSRRRVGTGFFVSQYIIVTCAHVLPGPTGTVTVHAHGREVTGKILVRLPAKGGSGSYPFPDLAFIGVEQGIDSPSAEVRTLGLRSDEGGGIRLHIHGYNLRTPQPEAVLDMVEVRVESATSHYIKVVADGIVEGMSGAPVVDPSNGYVCGILKNYRPDQGRAWYIDGLDVLKAQDTYRRLLGRHEPSKPRLIRPDVDHPLHQMLSAQRTVAEELPYQVVEGDVPLSTVYVEQRAEAWQTEVRRARALNLTAPPEPTVLSPYEMLARHRNALVVGGPGGGKSTLLQHLVAESAQWWSRPEPAEPGEEPKFGPAVAIRCPATRLLTGTAWTQAIADAVNGELSGFLNTPVPSSMFERPPMPNVEWLILVDGLDEVLDAAKRSRLIRILATRVGEYGSQARFVVTSRRLVEQEFLQLRSSLAGGQQGERLGEYDLRPFDAPAVQTFAVRWFALRAPDQAAPLTTGFLTSIERSRLMPLVSIPLLCTIAADVYQESPDSPLPPGRAGLYQRFIDGLLHGRRLHQDARAKLLEQLIPVSQAAVDFGDSLWNRRLDCVTHLAKQRLSSDEPLTLASAEAWLAEQGIPVPLGVTRRHIQEALLSTGLLVNRGDSLEFTHQSIAEYLNAGPAAERFDEQLWLHRVDLVGADSTSLFTLDRWASAGNDPMPVVRALADPGGQREYPRLPQLAAALEDGAALAGGTGDAAIELTIDAVRRVSTHTDRSLSAVNHAARALLQRAPDTRPLALLAGARRVPVDKRIEVAKALMTDGTEADRARGLSVLIALAYRERPRRLSNLKALRALADVGGPAERPVALQHLAQLVETAPTAQARVEAAQVLTAVGEPGQALAAMVRRLVDPARPAKERCEVADELSLMPLEATLLSEETDRQGLWYERPELPPGRVWPVASQPASYDEWSAYHEAGWRLGEMAWRGFAVDGDTAADVVTRLMYDRTLSWPDRTTMAWSAVTAERPALGQLAFEAFAGDTEVPAEHRVVMRWISRQRTDPAAADALLRSIVDSPRATVAEKRCALNVLMNRGERGAAREFVMASANSRALAPPVRIEAALLLARRGGAWQSGEWLDAFVTEPGVPRSWRWVARAALRSLPLWAALDRLVRLDRHAT